MAYSAYAVANAFIQRARERGVNDLTPMKLQKLLYLAQAWNIKVLGQPLLDDHFSRWQYGPVIPAMYHEFKDFGARPINRMATTLAAATNGDFAQIPIIPEHDRISWSLIDAVLNRYGHLDGYQLGNLTHQMGSGWAANGGRADGSVITIDEMMRDQNV
ncbi:DUF4065 domain-containing protein [Alcaligenes nematophilus]|uniref:DUF4065 domain-containing protein n=1 Tax=Alcaligenes nematophilus TaxID=2994643 RepID=A0ABU3MU92_9BURK|nr:type II toxin-antitoxin system antitoxin SocA domain-containing protein [Alcaligenes nematophilus]MDT8505166.1 DUF4065 domain-containing protein [Alcaligenes nematophilus]